MNRACTHPVRSSLLHPMLCVVAVMACLPLAASAGDTESLAALLKGCARTHGLVTVLSMSERLDADLPLGLARAGLSVHVLLTRESARDALVNDMGAKPGSDIVTVERLALSALPYLDHFVNLLVIDDARLPRKVGLSQGEMERVVAPGGAIAVRSRGGWEFWRKPFPAGMDNWTHTNYDASSNRVSKDELVVPPFGYKWIDGNGVPVERSTGCRGWVVLDGVLYSVTGIVPENEGLIGTKPEAPEEFLEARDAFNGLVLWKQRLGPPLTRTFWSLIEGTALIKVAALAVDSHAVYAVRDGRLTAFSPATGAELFACGNEYLAWAVRVSGNTIVTAGFGRGEDTTAGGVEAFDAATGARRWSLDHNPNNVMASSNAVFVQVKGATVDDDYVLGCELVSGRELFRLTGAQLGGHTPRLLSCGDDYVLVNKHYATLSVSPADGTVLWQLDSVPYSWGPVIDRRLWVDGGAYDVVSGRKEKEIPGILLGEGFRIDSEGSDFGCVAFGMVGNMTLSGRHHRYQFIESDTVGLYYYRGMRAACGPSLVAADGMLFAPPVNCICSPVHPYGFTAIAPVGSDPTTAEFETAKPVEQGPAFGTLDRSVGQSEWPMYRANPQRSSSSSVPSHYTFTPAWETTVLSRQDNGLVGHSLVSRTLASLSPPVVGCGKVFVAVTDRGEVVALDEQTGAEAWRYRAGARVETSPTIYGNGCFFGCNDGYVYALSADDGSTMWRTRIAPRERRMLEHGLPESVWPVYGAVLAYRDMLFASAGRNSEDGGGTVVVALDPATGERIWSRHLNVVMQRKNDVLSVEDGRIVWQNVRFEAPTGECDLLQARAASLEIPAHSGMWDNTHIYMPGSRRTGTVFTVDKTSGWLLAWNERYIVDDKGAVHSRADTSSVAQPRGRRRGPVFDITTQPTALVACAKSALAGYGAANGGTGRLVVLTGEGSETASIPLSAGVQHNAIAVSRNGVAVSLENGAVAFLRNGRLPDENTGVVVRVNCAGEEYTDSKGVVWSADREYTPGGFGRVGGGAYDRTPDLAFIGEVAKPEGGVDRAMRKNVTGPDPYLYMTELSGMPEYRFTVPNGHYEVVMHFAETYYFNTMLLPNGDLCWVHRRFDVALNGAPVLQDFEPAAENDGVTHIPVVKRFETDVADGDITISFAGRENNPIINAIEVTAVPGKPGGPQSAEAGAGLSIRTD